MAAPVSVMCLDTPPTYVPTKTHCFDHESSVCRVHCATFQLNGTKALFWMTGNKSELEYITQLAACLLLVGNLFKLFGTSRGLP